MSAYLHAVSYWRSARNARHSTAEIAMFAQANLWNIATSPVAPEKVRKAAYRHLEIIGEAPANPYGEMYEW
jgi:hypothetical protein